MFVLISDPNQFIGAGRSPQGVDIPLGLGVRLAQHPDAMDAFGRLSPQRKAALIADIQASVSGDEAKRRIERAVRDLGRGAIR